MISVSVTAVLGTLHLLCIPGMRNSIQQGMKESLEECEMQIDL